METRRLGRTGPEVGALGLGCMGMSDFYGPANEAESIATIHAAVDAGVTLLDTGDFYGMGHNEMLIREALRGVARDRVVLSVKFGALRQPGGAFLGFDGRPVAVKTSLAYSLKRLGTDYIDVYRPARVDPAVPIEDTVGAIADMVAAGHVRHLGLSEASATTVRKANAVLPVVDLQHEYSLFSRGIERDILPTLRELGVGVTAYGVLSRGLISDTAAAGGALTGFRSHLPRFQGENFAKNLTLVEAIRGLAAERGVTVPQLAFAWALSRGEDVIPLVGTTKRTRLTEALGAMQVRLTPEEVSALEAAVPADAVAGTRYGADQMVMLDSERR